MTLIDPKAGDAAQAVVVAWDYFTKAKTPIEYATAVERLSNAMSDLASWVPPIGDED